ncbi:hypothetical protein FHT77_005509 [Rhizobium sp. BK181]|uniref:hypothetical protein n=1 Tax=Rhizobium sp. BK181 TaxID=2587072 RepID=UPI001613BCB8|nr:hypothetical protein [Rhizobium sp. BK181]MBB3319594.1 hypothetical protein [Rhizobium sp. BK181]
MNSNKHQYAGAMMGIVDKLFRRSVKNGPTDGSGRTLSSSPRKATHSSGQSTTAVEPRPQTRSEHWIGQITETERLYSELQATLLEPDLTVAELQAIELKVAVQVKATSSQLAEYHQRGIGKNAIDTAERLVPLFDVLSIDVANRIERAKTASEPQ